MAWYRAGGGGIPSAIKTDMNAVLNKKFGTSQDYPPTDWAPSVNLLGPLPEKTASGSVAAITDGADDVPLKSWEVTLPALLSGYSAIGCTKSGKNLLNDSVKGINGANIYFGHNTGTQNDFSVWLKAGTYTISVVTADGTITNIYVKDSDTNTNLTGFPAYSTLSKTFTLANDTNCAVFVYKSGYSSVSDITSCQIEVGSSASSYSQYTAPTTATASLGRTIYGGSVDVVNGTGTETYTGKTISDLEWTRVQYQSSGIYGFRHISSDKKNGAINVMADGYATATSGHGWGVNMEDMTIVGQTGTGYIFIRDDRYSTAEAFTEAVTGKVAYELATGTDFTFTPITPTPETALGVNNFWADEGDSDVTYRADINLVLQSLGGRGLSMMRPINTEEIEYEEDER